MTASLTLDVTSVLEMAALAVLAAFALRLPPARSRMGEAGRGVFRALCGSVAAVAVWVSLQLAGQVLEPRIAPQWAMAPIVTVPSTPGFAVRKGPGQDI